MVEQKIAMDYRDRAECRARLMPYGYDSGGQTQLTRLCRESVDLFLRCCLISKKILQGQHPSPAFPRIVRKRYSPCGTSSQ